MGKAICALSQHDADGHAIVVRAGVAGIISCRRWVGPAVGTPIHDSILVLITIGCSPVLVVDSDRVVWGGVDDAAPCRLFPQCRHLPVRVKRPLHPLGAIFVAEADLRGVVHGHVYGRNARPAIRCDGRRLELSRVVGLAQPVVVDLMPALNLADQCPTSVRHVAVELENCLLSIQVLDFHLVNAIRLLAGLVVIHARRSRDVFPAKPNAHHRGTVVVPVGPVRVGFWRIETVAALAMGKAICALSQHDADGHAIVVRAGVAGIISCRRWVGPAVGTPIHDSILVLITIGCSPVLVVDSDRVVWGGVDDAAPCRLFPQCRHLPVRVKRPLHPLGAIFVAEADLRGVVHGHVYGRNARPAIRCDGRRLELSRVVGLSQPVVVDFMPALDLTHQRPTSVRHVTVEIDNLLFPIQILDLHAVDTICLLAGFVIVHAGS